MIFDLEGARRREVQAIGAAISTRSWHDVETAYNALRDKMDAVLHQPTPSPTALSPQTLPAPGEVERLRAIVVKHTKVGGYPDTMAIAQEAYRASLATVAAANDEGVARAIEAAAKICDERAAGRIRMYEDNQAGINAFKAVEAEECAAAIRLLSQGGGKA